jgi:hypothetical protein
MPRTKNRKMTSTQAWNRFSCAPRHSHEAPRGDKLALLTLLLCVMQIPAAYGQSVGRYVPVSGDHIEVSGNQAVAENFSTWVPAPPGKLLAHMEITFKILNKDKADALLKQMQDPSSPLFGRGMSSEDYLNQFQPSEDKIGEIVQWLKHQGFTVTDADRNRIIFNGTVGLANTAFKVAILESPDQTKYGDLTDPYIPVAFSDAIGNISGLTNSNAII